MTTRPRSSRRRPSRIFASPTHSVPAQEDHFRGEQISDYIAAIAAELQKLALSGRLTILAYLLDMARLEAENTARALRLTTPGADDSRKEG